jgi:hypothetical protein
VCIIHRKIRTNGLHGADNKALDAEPPIASFLKLMLIGGGPDNAAVILLGAFKCGTSSRSYSY